MKNIQRHCADLANLIARVIDYEDPVFDGLYYWLRLASGIKDVKYDSYLLDDGSGLYCSTARYWDDKQDVLEDRFVNNLTLFLYIWNTVESTYRTIYPPKLKRFNGKINRLCNYISSNQDKARPIPQYTKMIDALHNLSHRIEWSDGLFKSSKPSFVNTASYGLFLSYKIRNIIAHAEDIAPKTPQRTSKFLSGASLLPIVSRIVLMSIQQLLIIYTSRDEYYCDELGYYSEEGEIFDHIEALQNIHLKKIKGPLLDTD